MRVTVPSAGTRFTCTSSTERKIPTRQRGAAPRPSSARRHGGGDRDHAPSAGATSTPGRAGGTRSGSRKKYRQNRVKIAASQASQCASTRPSTKATTPPSRNGRPAGWGGARTRRALSARDMRGVMGELAWRRQAGARAGSGRACGRCCGGPVAAGFAGEGGVASFSYAAKPPGSPLDPVFLVPCVCGARGAAAPLAVLPQVSASSGQCFAPSYGVCRVPDLFAGGYRITSVFGFLNCATSWPFTPWNCASSTRGAFHSPFGPNAI